VSALSQHGVLLHPEAPDGTQSAWHLLPMHCHEQQSPPLEQEPPLAMQHTLPPLPPQFMPEQQPPPLHAPPTGIQL
jgi:hypothetical protein